MKRKKLLKLIIPLFILLLIIIAYPNHYFSDGKSYTDFSTSTTNADKGEMHKVKRMFKINKNEYASKSWHAVRTDQLFTEKGSHKFQIKYGSASDYNYYEIYSLNDMNKNGSKGVVYKIGKLRNTKDENGNVQNKTVTIPYDLAQNVNNLQIKVVYQDDMTLFNLLLCADQDFDKAGYFIFLAIVLTVIYYLTNVKYAGEDQKDARRTVLILFALIVYISLPFMNNFIINGDDTRFHLARVSGMFESMRDGHFPIFINPKQANLYGYATPIMYPQIFLLIPAVFRYLGMSLMGAYKLFIYLINISGVCIAYYAFKHIFSSRRIGIVSCFAYMLSMYFINNQFQRNALGETIAMIFAPLLLLSLYEIYVRDEHKWPLLVISLTGILGSHVISTFMYGFIALISFIILIPYMWKNHFLKRLISLIKAGMVTLLLNAFFLIPFIKYLREPLLINYQDPETLLTSFLNQATYLSQLFISKTSNVQPDTAWVLGSTANEMPLSVGFLSLVIIIVFTIIYITRKDYLDQDKHMKKVLKLGLFSSVSSIVLLYMSTDLFPWSIMAKLPLVKNFISIQFPWRLLAPTTLFLAVLAGCVVELLCAFASKKLSQFKKLPRIRFNLISQMICVIAIILIGWNSFDYIQSISNKESLSNKVDVNVQTFTDELYLYAGSSLGSINARGDCITSSLENVKLYNCQRKGTTITFDYKLPKKATSVTFTMPLNYYYNYKATNNGKVAPTHFDAQHFVQVDVQGHTGKVTVYYQAPISFFLGYVISGVTLLLIVIALIIYKKKISGV